MQKLKSINRFFNLCCSNVAIKVIETQKFDMNPKLLELCLTEISVLQQVHYCPYIVQFIELIKTPLKYYFIYEFCQGGPLDKQLNIQGHFTEQKTLQIFWQLIQAFKKLQQYKILHRDLKPSNILLHNGNYKLADFGFCKLLKPQQDDLTTTMLGSPIYMAPEVLRGFSYGDKADIWSLGCVIFELLTGKCPFEEKSIARLITAQDSKDWSIPEGFQFSQNIISLLTQMLIKDPSKRCTWDYLFSLPVTKEGFFKQDDDSVAQKDYQPLNPIENSKNQNLIHPKQTSYLNTQFSLAYSPLQMQKFEEKKFQGDIKLTSLQQPNLNLPPKKQNDVNILQLLIDERKKIEKMCQVLNKITTHNYLSQSSLYGFRLLQLIQKRALQFENVLKNYETIQQIQEYSSLHELLMTMKKKNSFKKLSNNFEFVRVSDTILNELNEIKASYQIYRKLIDLQFDIEDEKTSLKEYITQLQQQRNYTMNDHIKEIEDVLIIQ